MEIAITIAVALIIALAIYKVVGKKKVNDSPSNGGGKSKIDKDSRHV